MCMDPVISCLKSDPFSLDPVPVGEVFGVLLRAVLGGSQLLRISLRFRLSTLCSLEVHQHLCKPLSDTSSPMGLPYLGIFSSDPFVSFTKHFCSSVDSVNIDTSLWQDST